jgi:hypothetical protein
LVRGGWISAADRFTLGEVTFEQAATTTTAVELRCWEASGS